MQLDFLFREPNSKKTADQETLAAKVEEEKLPIASEPVPSTTHAAEPHIFSISELNRAVRDVLEGTLGEVWVRGEISNHRCQSSGHHYFSLKDAGSQISCVLFAGTARRMRKMKLEDGREVQAFGRLSVYEARGQYQLVIEQVQEEGVGALQAKFEALKASLAAEGLFETSRKKPLPRFPQTIGVVTSPTGAAIRDFLHVLHRRMPGIHVIIYPVRVQGRGAAAEIAAAIRAFEPNSGSNLPAVDVIVATRGGGSVEDLWEFNEEAVARAIAASSIPVVSAVGHEIDFTISDFVADFRAPTPSAAAEILAADGVEMIRMVATQSRRLHQTVTHHIRFHRSSLAALERSAWIREPKRRVEQHTLRVDDCANKLSFVAQNRLQQILQSLKHAAQVLAIYRPDAAILRTRDKLNQTEKILADIVTREVFTASRRLDRVEDLLAALSPTATLARGFTITTDAAGNILRNTDHLRSGVPLRTRFLDGEVSSSVTSVTRK